LTPNLPSSVTAADAPRITLTSLTTGGTTSAGTSAPTTLPPPHVLLDKRAERLAGRAVAGAADALAFAVTLAGATLLTVGTGGTAPQPTVAWLAVPVWLLLFSRYGLHAARHVAGRKAELVRLTHAFALCVASVPLIGAVADMEVPRRWLLTVAAAGIPVLLVERELVRHWFAAARRRGRFLRPVAVVGDGAEAATLVGMLRDQPELGYRVVALVADNDDADINPRSKVLEQLQTAGIGHVLMATTDVDHALSNRLVRSLTDAGIHVELSSSLRDIDASRLSVRPLGRHPVLYVEPVRRTGWRAVAKRGFDVAAAALIILVTAPLTLVVAAAVKATSHGPVLFKQERVGRRGRRFHVYKFRTMVADAEQLLIDLLAENESDGPLFKLRCDPRVTRIGRVLRKCSIDELPQLLNVLKGEMSLVGPRPALPGEVTQWDPELFERLRVQPGITGMWQVNGRSDSSFSEYQRWDLYYVDNWSIWRDLGILCKTLPVVLRGEGAY
jgi:exopolysaccharide biosynthesis polyprenyl glycosylphosphotransferase